MHEIGLELGKTFKPARNEISRYMEVSFKKGKITDVKFGHFSDLTQVDREKHIAYIKSLLHSEELEPVRIGYGPNTIGTYMKGLVQTEMKSEDYIKAGLLKLIEDKAKDDFILRMYKSVYDVPVDSKRLYVQGHFSESKIQETYHFVVAVIIPLKDDGQKRKAAAGGFLYPGFSKREAIDNEIDILDHNNKHFGVNLRKIFHE